MIIIDRETEWKEMTMGYEKQLRQARELLQEEIGQLRQTLASKEAALRKLEGLLKGTGPGRGEQPSLTSQIVTALYRLAPDDGRGVPAKTVIKEFEKSRQDVNASTIRSTLYQVARKLRPTEISLSEGVKKVRVLKEGPLYKVELVSPSALEVPQPAT